jgi:hypothetical protein
VLFAWLITFPKCGPLPHNSHFIAISIPVQSTQNVKNVSHHSSRPTSLFPLTIDVLHPRVDTLAPVPNTLLR